MVPDIHKLDNPVWNSLHETHKDYVIDYKNVKFYGPDYGPFGGFVGMENLSDAILNYARLVDNFFVVGEKPDLPFGLTLKNDLICLQMMILAPISFDMRDEIVLLKNENLVDLLGLVKIVYPEYFKKKTFDLGHYFGIFKEGQLVAVTGERMQMNDFIEISAVITHPEHTGQGYAQQLVAHTANKIFDQNKIPYLHVSENNSGAIKLYSKLGFIERRKISFWNLIKDY